MRQKRTAQSIIIVSKETSGYATIYAKYLIETARK